MAESAVSFLLDQLSTLIREESELLGGIGEDAEYIRNELEHMRAFLRVADAKEQTDPVLQAWVREVREIAYDAEDILDEFLLHFPNRRPQRFYGRVHKVFISIKGVRARHRLGVGIRGIKSRIGRISRSYQDRYASAANHQQLPASTWHDYRSDALLLEDHDLVGMEGPKRDLRDLLLSGGHELKVHAVVGMGGLGKTTLARKVYEDAAVKKQFQHHAWITVSESFNVLDDMLRDIARQFFMEMNRPIPSELHTMKTIELKKFLQDFLRGKRYLVVLDDVWRIDAWKEFRYIFPKESVNSRVVLTSRSNDVGKETCCETGGYVYALQPLPQQEARYLFCKRAFVDGKCPSHLNEISESILKRCGGLPLAIVVIAGVLRRKEDNLEGWERFERSMRVELERNQKLGSLTKLLSLSYYDLPYYLKLCLLYLSIYPEDMSIRKKNVIQLWIAEGFVREEQGMTREEVGEGYFNELVNRSLITVSDKYFDGSAKACRIHDILREIIVSKSKEHNIVTILSDRGRDRGMPNKVRRIAVHGLSSTGNEDEFSSLRSLILSGGNTSLPSSWLQEILSGGSRLVKVLNVRGAPLMKSIPSEVFSLLHLKYLNLVNTEIQVMPKAIGRLSNLQVLNLKRTKVRELPVEILKLHRLRRISLYNWKIDDGYHLPFGNTIGFKAPYRIGRLPELQKLRCIEAHYIVVREIRKLTKLRALTISKLRRGHWKDLCASIEKLTDLRRLGLLSAEEGEAIDVQDCFASSNPPPQFLESLRWEGRLETTLGWISRIHSLKQIDMRWTRFKDDPLEHFGDLPNLGQLVLYEAYDGEELVFRAGAFRKLKELYLCRLRGLRRMRVEQGAMPLLEEIAIVSCGEMEQEPSGLRHLRELKKLHIYDVGKSLMARLKRAREEISVIHWVKKEIAHISEVFLGYWTESKGWEAFQL